MRIKSYFSLAAVTASLAAFCFGCEPKVELEFDESSTGLVEGSSGDTDLELGSGEEEAGELLGDTDDKVVLPKPEGFELADHDLRVVSSKVTYWNDTGCNGDKISFATALVIDGATWSFYRKDRIKRGDPALWRENFFEISPPALRHVMHLCNARRDKKIVGFFTSAGYVEVKPNQRAVVEFELNRPAGSLGWWTAYPRLLYHEWLYIGSYTRP